MKLSWRHKKELNVYWRCLVQESCLCRSTGNDLFSSMNFTYVLGYFFRGLIRFTFVTCRPRGYPVHWRLDTCIFRLLRIRRLIEETHERRQRRHVREVSSALPVMSEEKDICHIFTFRRNCFRDGREFLHTFRLCRFIALPSPFLHNKAYRSTETFLQQIVTV